MTWPVLLLAGGFIVWIGVLAALFTYGLVLISERDKSHGVIAVLAGLFILAAGYLSIERFG